MTIIMCFNERSRKIIQKAAENSDSDGVEEYEEVEEEVRYGVRVPILTEFMVAGR